MSEKSIITTCVAVTVAMVLMLTILMPAIEEASTTTIDIEANDNPSWIRMSYYTGRLDESVGISYSDSYTVGTQTGTDDVIFYADDKAVVYSDNGTFRLYSDTLDVILNSPFTITVSGYVTTVKDNHEYVLAQHLWMYFPDPNGHCSTYYDVDFRTDTPIAAVSETFAGMTYYNSVNGISMTVVKNGETIDDVYWGERTEPVEPRRGFSATRGAGSYTINGTVGVYMQEGDGEYGWVPRDTFSGSVPGLTFYTWYDEEADYGEFWVEGTPTTAGTWDITAYGSSGGNAYIRINIVNPSYTHTIYYNANGGSGSMGATTITNTNSGNSNVTFAQNGFTAPAHYHFTGWKINNTGTLYQPGNTYPVGGNGSVTAYAQWAEDTRYNHTIAYNGNGATGGSTANTVVNNYTSGNTNVTLAANGYTWAHHTFTGWKINNSGTLYQPGNTIAVGGNATVTVYAQWLEDTRYTHTINYDMGTGTGGTTTSTVIEDYNSGNTAVTFAQNGFTKEHYHFIGWDVGGVTYQPGATINITGNGSVTATALWAEDTRYDHTIVYDAGTGTGTMSNTNVNDYNSGNTAVILASNGFTKEHYHFVGWSIDGVVYQPGDTVNVAGDSSVTATAQWEEDTRYDHTIIYDANTGSGTMNNTVVNDYNSGNTNVTFAQNNFTKTNHHFIGWRVAGVDYQPGDTIAVAGNSSVTAYAQWEEDTRYTHTVIYNAGTGSGSMSDTVITDYNSGNTAVTLAACTFTKTNYHFIGWLVGVDTYQAGQTVNVIGDGSITAIAQWDEDPRYTHTITYDAGIGTGTMSATVITDYNSGNTNVTFASNGFTKEHYHFIGWLVGVDTYNPGDTIAVAGNSSVTATAQWEEDTRYTHTIQYDIGTGTGGSTPDTILTDYNNGSSAVTLAQCGFTKTNYHFISWRYNGDDYQPGDTINVSANGSITVTAIWEEDTRYTHTIQYNANLGSGTMADTTITDYNSVGTLLILSANGFTAPTHYHFIGWSINDETYSAGDTVSVLGDATVIAYAIWEEDTRYDHTITYNIGTGTGGSTPDTVINDYNSGATNVTFAQNGFTKEHYHFIGWDVSGTTYQPGDTIAINGDTTITATAIWEEDTRYTHTITYNSGNGSGTMMDTVITDYESGTTHVTLATNGFTAPTHYHFIGWKINDSGTLYQPGETITVNGDSTVTVYAQWEEDTRYDHTIIYSGGGGSGTMENTVINDYEQGNTAVTFAQCGFVNEYYTFIGWDVEGTTYQPGDTIQIAGDTSVTAYAQWENMVYEADNWSYIVENGYITLLEYLTEPTGTLVIPTTLNGLTINKIGDGIDPIITSEDADWTLDLNNATTISENAFNGCTHLTGTLELPNTITSVGESAFASTSLTGLISSLSNSAIVGQVAFAHTPITEVLDLGTMEITGTSFGLDDATVQTSIDMLMCVGDYADSFTKETGRTGPVYSLIPVIPFILIVAIMLGALSSFIRRN